ncbi:hypothetical protein NC652_028866 [Populus alba x Populus x berolinensis]|nr:hypothetical protein NC652_028866 [Populus alba x Populus x berolinensis]
MTINGELMEFEGSCPQDTVGLVVLKGLSLSASTRENLDLVVVLIDTVHALIRTSFVARLMAAVLGDICPSHLVLWEVYVAVDFYHSSSSSIRWSSMVKDKQQNLSWQFLFSCVVWNLWLHRNDVIFNDAAPNLQICFSMVRQSIALWLRLDSNSLELNIDNV